MIETKQNNRTLSIGKQRKNRFAFSRLFSSPIINIAENNEVKQTVDQFLGTAETHTLAVVRAVCANIKMKHDAEAMFCAARKIPLLLERNVSQAIDGVSTLLELAPVAVGGEVKFDSSSMGIEV